MFAKPVSESYLWSICGTETLLQRHPSEPVVSNDYKSFGPFIMVSVEIERTSLETEADDEARI
jgi:hypothetical protein